MKRKYFSSFSSQTMFCYNNFIHRMKEMNNSRVQVGREQSDLNIIFVEIQSDSWDIEWNNEPPSSYCLKII